MSERRSIIITDEDLDDWLDQNIQKGEFNGIANRLFKEYQQQQKQEYIELQSEEKTDRRALIFQMVMFLSLGVWMLLFVISQYIQIISFLAADMMIFCGILLCVHTMMQYRTYYKKQKEVAA